MTTTTDAAASAAIYAATKDLRLPAVRADSARLAELAQRSQLSYLGFLAEVLSAEVDRRNEHRRHRRVSEARFPRLKRLADFDLGAAPTVNPATISTLASCAYLDAGDPVVLLGDSGTGKSHLLIGLGLAACERGRRAVTPPAPSSSTNWPKRPTSGACPAWWPATGGWTCCAWTYTDPGAMPTMAGLGGEKSLRRQGF